MVIKKKMTFALCLIIMAMLISCVNKQDRKNREQDRLILAIGGEPDGGFDPTTGWGQYGSPLFQSTLLRYDKDFNIENDLATSFSINSDGKEWLVHIKDSVEFSDGTPLTAEDVVFTFLTAKKSASIIDLTNLSKVEAIDKLTIKLTLFKRNSTFIHYLTTIGIVPKSKYSSIYSENPIGSGPYIMVQWDKGQQLILKENPLYYGKKPYFKKLIFLFLSEDAAFAAAKAGQVDVATVTPTLANEKIKGMKLIALKSVDNRGVVLPYIAQGKERSNGLAIGNDVTSDIAIRKAMNKAVNRTALVNGILKGYGTPAYSIADNLPWCNRTAVIEKDGDIESAKKILENGGWKIGSDGVREKNGIKAEFKLLYPANDHIRQSLSIAFADMMKPLGINVIIKGMSWNGIDKELHSSAVLFGLGSHDPLELYNTFSTTARGNGYNNPNYYSNPTVDYYFDKALEAANQAEAYEYWKKAQWDGNTGFSDRGDSPWVWLVNIDHLYFIRENLEIGEQKIQPHEHSWPITDFIENWQWK